MVLELVLDCWHFEGEGCRANHTQLAAGRSSESAFTGCVVILHKLHCRLDTHKSYLCLFQGGEGEEQAQAASEHTTNLLAFFDANVFRQSTIYISKKIMHL